MRLSNYLMSNERYLFFILRRYSLDVHTYNQQVSKLMLTHKHIIDWASEQYKISIIPYLWTIWFLSSRERSAFVKYYTMMIEKYDGKNTDFIKYLLNEQYFVGNIPGDQCDLLIFIIMVQYYFL